METLLDFQDHSVPALTGVIPDPTIKSRAIASGKGFENRQHTLRISMPKGDVLTMVDKFV